MGSSKVLIIGATGFLGQNVTNASIKLGHPTFALVRTKSPSDPAKAAVLKSFQDAGVTLLIGDLTDHASLVAALKQVEVVIATVGGQSIEAQLNILEAAKETRTIKRFYPSDFGNEVDRLRLDVPILKAIFGSKQKVRRAAEKSGIPYTFVSSNSFAEYFVAPLNQDDVTAPPRHGKLLVLGDGNAKAVFNELADIGTFTIKSIDDPRAENKILLIAPKENVFSQNELIALWEKKIGHTFEKEFLDAEGVRKSIDELPIPRNITRAIKYSILVQGEQTWFELDPSKDVEATALYPDVKYTTVSEFLDRFVKN